jgi:hypothetical protein
MDAVIQYVQERWMGFAAGLICLGVVLYLTRRHSFPLMMWCAELLMYTFIMHTVVCGLVAVTAWFKFESQMKMLVSEKERVPWNVPFKAFWDRSLYNPSWLFYLEIALVIVMIAGMIYYKPMVVQKLGPKRERLVKGKAPTSPRGGQSYGAGRTKGRRR